MNHGDGGDQKGHGLGRAGDRLADVVGVHDVDDVALVQNADQAAVLADLERFCHANSTTHVEGDSHGTAQLEGRRQVWLRIQGYRNLSDAEIGEFIGHASTEED